MFDNEEQAVLLKALLSSNRPEDLETANNLIKTLVETVSFFFKKSMFQSLNIEL